MINTKTFPNFWQGLLITPGIYFIIVIIGGAVTLAVIQFFGEGYNSQCFINELDSFTSLFFLPIIYYYYFKLGKFRVKSSKNWKNINVFIVFVIAVLLSIIDSSFISMILKVDYSTLKSTNLRVGQLCLIFITPAIEELLFRGVYFNSFIKQYKLHSAIVLSSVLFALSHMQIYFMHIEEMLLYFMIYLFSGIVLCLVYYKAGSLILAVLLHVFINLLSTLHMVFLENKIIRFIHSNDLFLTKISMILISLFLIYILIKNIFYNK